jgi:hypothetical protein
MSEIISLLLAIFKAVPVLKEAWDRLLVLYIEHQENEMLEADRAAIRKAIDGQDQRDLEKQIGSTVSGKPSGIPGTEFRDSLPGVQAD